MLAAEPSRHQNRESCDAVAEAALGRGGGAGEEVRAEHAGAVGLPATAWPMRNTAGQGKGAG